MGRSHCFGRDLGNSPGFQSHLSPPALPAQSLETTTSSVLYPKNWILHFATNIILRMSPTSIVKNMKRKDGKEYREYRTERVILEIYDEMQRVMETTLTPSPHRSVALLSER
jgi:hypothetical protein